MMTVTMYVVVSAFARGEMVSGGEWERDVVDLAGRGWNDRIETLLQA